MAENERLGALNATQKTSALCKESILKNKEITAKITQKCAFLQKWSVLAFILNFSETVLCKELRFFALRSVHQDAPFEPKKKQ